MICLKGFSDIGTANAYNSPLLYKSKNKVKKALWKIFLAVIIATMSYLFLFPLYYTVIISFQKLELASDPTSIYVPKAFSLEAYKIAFKQLDYKNSALLTSEITLFSTVFSLISCSVTGYALARFDFKGKRLVFLLVLLMIIIPPQQIIVPQYMLYKDFTFGGLFSLFGFKVNLLSSPLVFILPAIFSVGLKAGMFIFVFRQFFSGLPKELEEAAKIDGCSAFQTFIKVMIPSAKPAFVVVSMLCIIWHWNDYYTSSMMFIDQVKPLMINLEALRLSIGEGGATLVEGLGKNSSYLQRMFLQAGVVLCVFPPFIVYVVMQKYFVESIERTGIVG